MLISMMAMAVAMASAPVGGAASDQAQPPPQSGRWGQGPMRHGPGIGQGMGQGMGQGQGRGMGRPHDGRGFDRMMQRVDTNHDGSLSREEIAAARQMMAQHREHRMERQQMRNGGWKQGPKTN